MIDTAHLAAALAGRYVIERELGTGGMATVYLAHDVKHDRPVALKVLRPDLAAVIGAQRFLAEIKVTANLQHPHIVTLIDSGESDGTLWYVLPYIRGESLRDRLNRERQLGVDDTLTMARQIASALDYAHAQGVIHRDIKPENILLHEGEAMLADFGIALAVTQAGGNRLTETGLSLGTPQYMSPEQATADRVLDARSDVYSLGAVVYEMLAGEPPHTGATAHAVIAKLLTERPVSLRVLRSTLPPDMDAAVSRALEKVAADRFPTAGEFARALESSRGTAPVMGMDARPSRARTRALVVGVPLGLVLLAVVGWLAFRGRARASAPPSFNLRTQVTFTGNATRPALSADGTEIAYVVHECTTSGCHDAIEIQDVDGAAKRRLVDSVSTVEYINWSPDRRFLIFAGPLGNGYASFLVPTLGGPPRMLGASPYAFLSSGDSVVAVDGSQKDTVGWLKTQPLDGEARDSVLVHGLAGGGYTMAFPGDRWLLLAGVGRHGFEARIVNRQAQQSDIFAPNGAQVGGNDVWSSVRLGGNRYGVVRLPVDLASGQFRPPADTVLDAASSVFDVSADERAIAYVEGVRQQDVWVMPLADAVRGQYSPQYHIFGSTSGLDGGLAPDGKHVFIEHTEAGPNGSRVMASVVPATGGAGVDYDSPANHRGAFWSEDGASIDMESPSANGTLFVMIDPQTGRQIQTFAISDTGVHTFDALPGGGWVWVPASHDRVRLERKARATIEDLRSPSGENVFNVNSSPDGKRLVTMGATAAGDTAVLNVISVASGQVTRWMTLETSHLWANWLSDGSLMASADSGSEKAMYRVSGPGHVQRLGLVPRAYSVSWSRDGRQVSVITSAIHGDVWLARSSVRKP